MISPFVYRAGDRLSEAELTAACLDGDLVALGEAYVPADVAETPPLRGASLMPLVGDTLAATHLSAAWVHGVLDEPPARHTVQRAVPRRLHHVIDRRLVYRDRCVDAADLQMLGGAAVTTRARTIADLARTPDDTYAAVLRPWAERFPDDIPGGLAWLDARPQLPHRRAATALLKGLRTT
jgi:hypothetical protein